MSPSTLGFLKTSLDLGLIYLEDYITEILTALKGDRSSQVYSLRLLSACPVSLRRSSSKDSAAKASRAQESNIATPLFQLLSAIVELLPELYDAK